MDMGAMFRNTVRKGSEMKTRNGYTRSRMNTGASGSRKPLSIGSDVRRLRHSPYQDRKFTSPSTNIWPGIDAWRQW
jgi:hypothetical protein